MDRRTLRSKQGKPRTVRPYDRQNQSIFGKVCSKVKGLLNPSWLLNVSQWIGNSEEEQPGCSTDIEEQSVRDDNDISSKSISHGSKRLRLRFEDHSQSPSIQSSATQTWPEPGPSQNLYETVSRVPASASQSSLLDSKETIPVLNGDDHSENSEGSASTSGCSSLVSSHKDINRLVESPFQSIRTGMKNRISQRESAGSKSGLSADLNSSRPLWSSSYSPSAAFQRRLSTTNQPNFNLSTFMGPSKLDKSMEKKVSSPFYQGNTTFGGASALRRMPSSVTPYQVDKTLRSQVRVREAHEDNLEGMSSAAKRILLTLEKMSSPVTDAKKMPNTNTSPVDLSLYLKPPKCRRNSQFTPSLSSKGPPIADINTIAKLATLKNYGVSRLRNSLTSNPVPSPEQKNPILDMLQPSTSDSPKSGGGKMKIKLNKQHHSTRDSANSESEVLNEPCLPNIPLPISKLPDFSFGSKSEKKFENHPSTSFKFSNPIEHEISSTESTVPLSHEPFKFSSPIEHELPFTSLPTTESFSSSSTAKTSVKITTNPLRWECSTCLVRNPTNRSSCMACETRRNSDKDTNGNTIQQKSQSTCVTSASTSNSNVKFGNSLSSAGLFTFGTQKTQAHDVKLNNIEQESRSSTAATSTSFSHSPISKFGNSTETPKTETQVVSSKPVSADSDSKKSATWECSSCWVRNPENKSKCLACEAARPAKASLNNKGSNSLASNSTLSNLKDLWECQTCLVRNPNKEVKCMACETVRSNINAVSDKSATWECNVCWVRNPLKKDKCLACETLHPNKDVAISGAGGFKFSSPSDSSPITFKFGSFVCTVPETSTTSTFVFGTTAATSQATTTTSVLKFSVASSATTNTFFTSDSTANSKASEISSPQLSNASGLNIPNVEAIKHSANKPLAEQKSDAVDNECVSNDKLNITQMQSTESVSSNSKLINALGDKKADESMPVITNTVSENISKDKETLPSVTSCFGFTTQPILVTKKSSEKSPYWLTFGVTKEKSNSSSATSAFDSFPVSSNKDKSVEDGSFIQSDSKGQVESTGIKIPGVFPLATQSLTTSAVTVSTSTPVFNFGEKTESSKAVISATATVTPVSTKSEVTDLNKSTGKGLAPFFQINKPQPAASAFTIPSSSTATVKFGEKTESSEIILSTASVTSVPTTSTFSFSKTASNFGLVPSSKVTETSSIASESLQQPAAVKSEDAKTVASLFPTATTAGLFSFGNSTVASTTPASSTFSFFSAAPTTTAVSSVFSFATSSSTAQTSKPVSAVTTANSVFTFGASSNTTQASKPGGFTFKSADKPSNAPNLTSASQPAAQGLLPDISATATAPAPSGGFVFGAAKTEPQSAASAPFTFGSGAPPSSSASAFSAFQPSQPPNPAFQFGNQSAQSSSPAFGSSTCSFSFGKTEPANQIPSSAPQNSIPAFGSTTTNFAFGSKTETPNQTNTVPQPTGFLPSASNFTFNNKNEIANPVSQAPAPAFGSSNIQPVFGNSTVPTFGVPEKPAVGGFNFGTSAAAVFPFGNSNTEKKPSAPSAGFTFGTPGASETNNSFPTTGFNISTPPSFNFGATSTPAGPLPFQFAASSSDVGASQTAPRKIRKAVRRVLRKD